VDWLQHGFIEQIPQHHLLLLLDGHQTHITLQVIKKARANNIVILKLPSHTTNILQPLDKSCFKPLKDVWREKLIAFQCELGFYHLGCVARGTNTNKYHCWIFKHWGFPSLSSQIPNKGIPTIHVGRILTQQEWPAQ
jgi:hypothetical protein